MAFNDKEQEIIKYGVQSGKTRQEVETAITNYRLGITPTKMEDTKKTPSYLERLTGNVGEDINTRTDRVGEIMKREDTGAIEKGVQVLGQGLGLAANTAEQVVGQIPGVKQGLEKVGEGIQWLSETAPIKALGDKIGGTDTLQELTRLYDTDQNFRDTVDATANFARIYGDATALTDSAVFAKNVTNKLGITTKEVGSQVAQKTSEAVSGVQDLGKKIVSNASEKNVNPQLSRSVENIVKPVTSQVTGATKSVKDPLKLYDEFAKQEKLFKTDIKQDTALGIVGERTGKAFDAVVKQRQSVGKIMGEELKRVGNVKTDTTGSFESFRTNLRDSGVGYDTLTGKITPLSKQTKFTTGDIKQLREYGKSFQKLGKNPTVSELDAYLSRISSELDLFKSKNNITGTTNAERIIKNSLANLRNSLIKSGNPELATYANARAQYSQLSDFLDEGVSFLGKKTQAGNYAKDASIAKSSVQSILNGGKKDWLLKLEELTGYRALDESVLALQAMKDAGNFRGNSLLDLLSPTEIPTSKAGVVSKAIDYGAKKIGDVVVGTPEEQTRRFIQEMLSTFNTNPTIPSSKIIPKKTNIK